MRHRCRVPRPGLLALMATTIALTVLLLAAAGAEAAYTIGPFELTGSNGLPAVQIPALVSMSQQISQPSGAAAYGSGARGAPTTVSELTITKRIDTSSPLLQHSVAVGSHYKSGSLVLQTGGSAYEALCMTDVYGLSYEVGGAGGSYGATETVKLGYGKLTLKYGTGANCSGVPTPPVVTSLVRLNRSATQLTARVDCLIADCRGIIAVSLPKSACPNVAAPSSIGGTGGARGSQCSFTGPVRVGINGDGKVRFNKDGTAFTGGVKLGTGGGKFSITDGSVRVLNLTVPQPLGKWMKGHPHATLGSIIVVRGLSKAIVQREVIGAPAKLDASVPSLTATGEPGTEVPPLQPQSLAITECSSPVPGTPTMISVNGTLSPPRGGAAVTLTYTPVNGPLPPPSPVVDSVTTTPTGNFGEPFDRRREGKDYSWNVVASIPAGGGYTAASSPACAIPIP